LPLRASVSAKYGGPNQEGILVTASLIISDVWEAGPQGLSCHREPHWQRSMAGQTNRAFLLPRVSLAAKYGGTDRIRSLVLASRTDNSAWGWNLIRQQSSCSSCQVPGPLIDSQTLFGMLLPEMPAPQRKHQENFLDLCCECFINKSHWSVMFNFLVLCCE
jgi:hypothetical protein